jgi:hypothetical protein
VLIVSVHVLEYLCSLCGRHEVNKQHGGHILRESQMEEMFKLGWMIGLVKHAAKANSLYFLYLLLLSIPKILAPSQLTL